MKFFQDSSSQTSLSISLMYREGSRGCSGWGLLRSVTLGEVAWCSGGSDQAVILWQLSVITGWLLCVWGPWSTQSRKEREGARQRTVIEAEARFLSSICRSCVEPPQTGSQGCGWDQAWKTLAGVQEAQGKPPTDGHRQGCVDPLKRPQSV